MIHRINSVAPDLDDRVIKPNQARSATNMRFGASLDDANLSGGILVNGMSLVDFNPNITFPDGSQTQSYVVGTHEDYESGYLYYAIYSFGGRTNFNHGILRVTISTDEIVWVVRGAWLNFSKTSNVSMDVIDGLLYWTDGINEPRMVNIARAINTFNGVPVGTDYYPTPDETNLWCFSQIKRSPQRALLVKTTDIKYPPNNTSGPGYFFTTDLTAGYTNKTWITTVPYQFSYYYIYDNNEESRLAPWSDAIYYINNLKISIPDDELFTYCDPANKTIVKYIVIVIRKGDEGTVYSIKKWTVSEFVFVSTETTPVNFPILTIPSALSVGKTIVPESIYDQRYDSVPLLSKTNTIANNILNHGNIVADYTDYGNIKIEVVPVQQGGNGIFFNTSQAVTDIVRSEFRTFRPGSNYTVGFQLIDEFGRATPVLQSTEVFIPEAKIGAVKALSTNLSNVCYPNGLNPAVFKDDTIFNQYKINIQMTGDIPSWVKYIRPCCTRNNTVNFFNKTICRLYFWYQNGGGENMYMRVQNDLASMRQSNQLLKNVKVDGQNNKVYTFKGYGLELSSDTPFLYVSTDEQFLKIGREYYDIDDEVENTGATPNPIEYKIAGQDGRIVQIEEDFSNLKFYSGYQIGDNPTAGEAFPLWYQVEFYTKKNAQETVFYDSWNYLNTVQITAEQYKQNQESGVGNSFFIDGDCYIAYFNKNFKGQSITSYKFKNYVANEGFWYVTPNSLVDVGYTVYGYFYSMNLSNISDDDWQSGLGLINIPQNNNVPSAKLSTSISFSNQYIRGTIVNGLNKFNPLNIRQAPAENGPISSLVTTNATQQEPGVMLAIGSLGISSFYYGAIQLTNVDGSSNLATTDQHLASQRPLLGQFGTSQPASITKTPLSTVYWWSDVVNDFIRYTNAGLERLGLTYSFSNKLRQQVAGKRVITAYDQVTDEAILIPEGGNSFIFSERFKTFQGYREYYNSAGQTPDRVVGMSTKTYFFLNGFMYVSKTDSANNVFFDRVAVPQLTIVTNEFPSVVKQWNSVKVYGPKPNTTSLQVGEAEGYFLETAIQPTWWIQRKGEYNAAIRRAIANGSDGTSGKVMESRILYSTFVFDVDTFDKLNFIEVKSNTAIVQ